MTAPREDGWEELRRLAEAWEALRQAIWENAPSYDPHDFIQDHRPAIEAAVLVLAAAREEPGLDVGRLAMAIAVVERDGRQHNAKAKRYAAEYDRLGPE